MASIGGVAGISRRAVATGTVVSSGSRAAAGRSSRSRVGCGRRERDAPAHGSGQLVLSHARHGQEVLLPFFSFARLRNSQPISGNLDLICHTRPCLASYVNPATSGITASARPAAERWPHARPSTPSRRRFFSRSISTPQHSRSPLPAPAAPCSRRSRSSVARVARSLSASCGFTSAPRAFSQSGGSRYCSRRTEPTPGGSGSWRGWSGRSGSAASTRPKRLLQSYPNVAELWVNDCAGFNLMIPALQKPAGAMATTGVHMSLRPLSARAGSPESCDDSRVPAAVSRWTLTETAHLIPRGLAGLLTRRPTPARARRRPVSTSLDDDPSLALSIPIAKLRQAASSCARRDFQKTWSQVLVARSIETTGVTTRCGGGEGGQAKASGLKSVNSHLRGINPAYK